MKKKAVWGALILVLSAASYFQIQKMKEVWEARVAARVDYPHRMAELDKSLLKKLSVRPSNLTSGDYILEQQFSDKPFAKHEFHLKFTSGQFERPPSTTGHRSGMTENLSVEGQIISWHEEGIMYDGGITYVGLIDGEIAWGRAYDGNGDKNYVGFWRLYKKPEK